MNSAKPRHDFWLPVVAIYSLYTFLSLTRINEAGSIQVAWKQGHKMTLPSVNHVSGLFQVYLEEYFKFLSCKQSTNQLKFLTWLEQTWMTTWNHWPVVVMSANFNGRKKWSLMISRLNVLRLTKLTFHECLQIDSQVT